MINEAFYEVEERYPTSLEHWSVFDDENFPINYHDEEESFMV